MINPHRDFAEEARAENSWRGVWVSENEDGTISVDGGRRMMPSHAREVAVGIVRLADKLDPVGSFVRREAASAWKPAATCPESGTILARNSHDGVFLAWRSSRAMDWCVGDSVFPRTVEEWTEVPQ